MLVEILIIVIINIIFFLILTGNNEVFRMTPSASSGSYRYSVFGGPTLTTNSVGFSRFLLFWVSLFAYVCVNLCVCGSVCKPSQGFENSLFLGFQWSLCEKIIKMQWLTLVSETVLLIMTRIWLWGSWIADKK